MVVAADWSRWLQVGVAVCLVFLLCIGTTPQPAAAQEGTVVGLPGLSAFAPDNRIVGGGQVTLDVYLTNEGRLVRGGPSRFEEEVKTASDVRLSVRTDDLSEELARNVEVLSGTIPAGNVPEGVSGPFPLQLEVNESLEPGTYDIPLEVAYQYTSVVEYSTVDEPSYRTFSRTQEIEVTLVVRDEARFAITTDGPPVTAGQTAVRQFTVENVGSEAATDARLRLASGNGSLSFGSRDAPSSTTQASLSRLEPGASRTVAVRVGASADLPPGGYPVTGSVAYRTPAGARQESQARSVTVPVGAEQTFAVENVSDTLRVGERGVVEGLLVNTGDRTVEDVTVVFPTEAPGLQARQPEFAVDRLRPGESVPYSFVVDTANGSVSGPRTLEFSVRYRDGEGNDWTADPGDALVTVAGEQTFELRSLSSDLQVGSTGTVRGTVVNTGETAVTNAVVVLADASAGLEPLERRVPVGDLEPGERATFTLPAAVQSTAEPGPQFLSFRVRYRGQGDEVATSDALDASVQVAAEPSFRLQDVESTLQVGDTGTVSGRLVNTGAQPVERATLVIDANGTGIQPRETEYGVGTLEPGESVPFAFSADVPSGVAPGPRLLPVRVRYRDDETRTSDPLDAPVRIGPKQSFALENVSGTLRVGERGQLTATLVNTGNATVSDVSLVAAGNGSLQPLSPAAAAGRLDPGESAPVAFTFDVPRTTDGGSRPLAFRVRHRGRDGAYRTTDPIEIQARVAPEQTFALSNVTSTLRVDDTGAIAAELINTGEVNASGVVLEVVSAPETLVPREMEYAVGGLAPGEQANVSFRVDATADAQPGPRLVRFRVRYRGQSDRTQQTDPIDARVAVAPERDEFRLTAVETTVEPGESTVVSLRVENDMNETLHNIRARLFVDDPLSSDDSEAFISQLESGENATLRFRLAADGSAIPKGYPLLVDFAYEDTRGEQQLSDTYYISATVAESEAAELPVSPPIIALALAAVVLAVGIVVWLRRRSR